jgi:predicted metalloprotease with PDZ domain
VNRIARMLIVLAGIAVPSLVGAGQAKCPLDGQACLAEFEKMRHRPFVGILVDQDSTGAVHVVQVVPGGPAARAGMKVGDVLISIEGVPIPDAGKLIVGKAGWKTGAEVHYKVRRGEGERNVALTLGQISDEQLARLIGEHMVEAHLAYLETGTQTH